MKKKAPPKQPLRILVLHHPDSTVAREVAQGLYRQLLAVGGTPGLRIPVRFAEIREDRRPPALDAVEALLKSAGHTLVVALLDGRMARRATASDRPIADA